MSVRSRKFRQEIERYYWQTQGRVAPLGMGSAYLGGNFDAAELRGIQRTLDLAYERGIRTFDTSAAYGESERRLGEFLRRVDRSTVFVATKGRIPPQLAPAEAAAHLRAGLEASRDRLGVEVIDLFQVHDVDTLDQVVTPDGALEPLVEARTRGIIRYIGLGTRWHDLLAAAAQHGEFDSILTYLDYNLIDQSAAPLIKLAAGREVGVINGSPLALGLLTGQDPRMNMPTHAEVRRHLWLAGRLYDFAQRESVSLLALALQFPQRNPGISITLTGAANEHELKANLNACGQPIPEKTWSRLQTEFGIRGKGAGDRGRDQRRDSGDSACG